MSLHEAVQRALNSPQARVAAANTEEAQGQLRQASLGLNPRLFLQSEDWRPWGKDFDFGSQTENYAFLSQTFETDGKRRKRTALGQARLAQAQADEQASLHLLVARVAGAYWNTVVLNDTVKLMEKDIDAVNGIVLYDQERVDAGAMRGVDLLRMRIERDRLLLALAAAKREASLARLELQKQIGEAPSTQPLALSDSLGVNPPVPPEPIDMVLARRPDLRAFRHAVDAARADLALQRADAKPNLDLIGGYKRNGALNTGYSSLQIDLPFRNRNQGEIERATASVHAAESALLASELRVRAEVAQNQASYEQQQEILQHTIPEMRDNAQENLRLLTEAYRMGGVDLLRFLDAERTAFDIEVVALRAQADLKQASLRLQLSYGEQP